MTTRQKTFWGAAQWLSRLALLPPTIIFGLIAFQPDGGLNNIGSAEGLPISED